MKTEDTICENDKGIATQHDAMKNKCWYLDKFFLNSL
jgi:hypothetical protein